MRTETIKIYNYNELSEEAKQKALDTYRYVELQDGDWYSAIDTELAEAGCSIKGFDLDYEEVTLQITSYEDFANNVLQLYHPEEGLYKVCYDFMSKEDRDAWILKFDIQIKQEILAILKRERNLMTSDEHVAEFLESSGLEFTGDGSTYFSRT